MEAAGFSTCVAAATGPFFSLLFTVEEINTEKKQGSTQMTLMADFYFCQIKVYKKTKNKRLRFK